jgi:hypothetical protein
MANMLSMIRKNHASESAPPTSAAAGDSGEEEYEDNYRGLTTRFPHESEVLFDVVLGMLMLDG